MNIQEMTSEIQKLEYQIKKLAYTVDQRKFPVEKLILDMDWDEKQINEADQIFEKYDHKLRKRQEIEWNNFETEFKEMFNIGRQTVKAIVEAFYRAGLWTDVCEKYCSAINEPNFLKM